ncbi:hypothetical protein Sj15T_09870 [Sphingobium sp. TA15]|uniref:Uncharacterized protein n=1 Tax=Sphingobium indicum (strain DSM 16413 / CCM 7287 / MTCC 6362 / UT26 / NBRC 101211 / UT26S) TaxID=452662 RepID=D4Z252_SPHIU|nr:hypothetical protein [Sphingobium indicum]BAI96684.1 hypothetical protein SJA_C1-18500 [Sphingobium indicum UT26S]BDD65966.1 hypothetical protein Sj15T_09870 [Sphingobium sp. TA15]
MTLQIHKIVLQVTILLDRSDRPRLYSMGLENIAREMDEGGFVGMVSTLSDQPLKPGDVHEELLAIGNDGCFFDLTSFSR